MVKRRCKWLFWQFYCIVTYKRPFLSDVKPFLYVTKRIHAEHSEGIYLPDLDVVGAILIGFLHIFISTGYPISHRIIRKYPFICKQLWHFKITLKLFSQLVPSLQKLAVLALTFLTYQNSPTFGALWILLYFSNENRLNS